MNYIIPKGLLTAVHDERIKVALEDKARLISGLETIIRRDGRNVDRE